ncbi:CpaF family protein [Brevibacillus dissolubilis]|uniref:CpaF family protein n=1 Tax=Brevibacillus dissolubilis TaxID=1844116 RepID=UPI00111614C3|nr:CpaF family protein [Brevibacillus dissolubilis]
MSMYDKIRSRKANEPANAEQEVVSILQKIRTKILVEIQRSSWEGQKNDRIQMEVQRMLDLFLSEEGKFLPKEEKDLLVAQIVQDMTGLGPIQPLLEDDSVSEIMVNGYNQIYVERNGRLELTSYHFFHNEHVMNVIQRIVSPLGRRVDESSPMVDARLPDGSRINAIIPPVALNGPTLTIRKFRKDKITIPQMIQFGTMSKEVAQFLDQAVKRRMNILVAGGTGSGKTTLLNALSSMIPENDRIVTIEDAAELRLLQPHVISLETRPSNIEGKGQITIRDLVRNSLRMRPDRIVVGEVRGGEALDMLQAMNTGHDGSLSTIHANSPRDVLSRLETLTLMAGYDLPVRAIREQISSAVDLIVFQRRFSDGTRKISHIVQVQGMEIDTIVLHDLFVYEEISPPGQSGSIKGRFKQVGNLPFGNPGEGMRGNGP